MWVSGCNGVVRQQLRSVFGWVEIFRSFGPSFLRFPCPSRLFVRGASLSRWSAPYVHAVAGAARGDLVLAFSFCGEKGSAARFRWVLRFGQVVL